VTVYLRMLKTEGFVSQVEHECLEAALEPLVGAHPGMRRAAVQAIRKEMGLPENNKYVLRDKEELYWRMARRKGSQPIKEFELETALRRFRVTPETDPDSTVVFLKPEHEHPVEPYVPPSLRMGEVFFYVVLRMFRYHCQRLRK